MSTTEIIFLLKFGTKEHIENLYFKGEIYMDSLKAFQSSKKEGIGDPLEGAYRVNNLQGTATFKVGDKKFISKKATLQQREYYKDHVGSCYSTYGVFNDKKQVGQVIDEKIMNENWSYCIFIKDPKKFTALIFAQLEARGIEYIHDRVKYWDLKKAKHELTLFDKDISYSYQSEYRIIAKTLEEKPLKLYLGSLHEFSEVWSSAEFVEKFRVE